MSIKGDSGRVSCTMPEDMAQSRACSERFFSGAADLPLSFVLDGTPLRGIPADWSPVTTKRRIDANIAETVFEGSDPGSGLNIRVECTQYRDYPVVEWVAWFTNKGQATTPILSDILAFDGAFTGISPVLDHSNGDFNSAEGYTPQETPVNAGDALAFAPSGGRPCDSAFPYYRIRFKDWGLSLAIGWPAQWSARFTGLADGVQVQAGQEKTHLRLMPGETIRTPRMTVMTWAGDDSRAVNLWRRWYLAHILPRPDGRPMRPLLACAATDEGEEFTAATEENQIRYLDKFRQRGIRPDVWWIDAGWYPCDPADNTPSSAKMPSWCSKWWNTGNWQPDPKRFPRGLKPVSDRAAQGGADLLLWFEPERVWPGSRLDNEHPEWLLKIVEQGEPWNSYHTYDNGLLNLGNPACRQWLTDHVCKLIQDNGVKIYRQDHNFPPLQHWRQNEAQDRQGMNENLYVQGYLQYWDDLLARNPGLWIDSCASGGRRNDLETMRRSVPLHYTDNGYGDSPVKLAFHCTFLEWMPYFKEFTLAWDLKGNSRFDHQVDNYSFHCGMAPMLFATLDIRRDDYDFELARKMIALWRRAAGLMLHGDYYPLTPFHRSADKWVARQFDCPETGRGLIQGIRLPASPDATLTVHPKGIRSGVTYLFENGETGEKRTVPGDALIRDGFTFELPPRNGAIWFYAKH
jgi:alpha-galactosidase